MSNNVAYVGSTEAILEGMFGRMPTQHDSHVMKFWAKERAEIIRSSWDEVFKDGYAQFVNPYGK